MPKKTPNPPSNKKFRRSESCFDRLMDLQALPPTQQVQVEADELTIISQDNLTSKNRSSKKSQKKRYSNRKSKKYSLSSTYSYLYFSALGTMCAA